jgi:predicted Fe-S protein YdhL (DUF1289 family)
MYKYSIAILLSLASFQPALAAETPTAETDLSKPVPSAEYKQLSPEQREKFHQERKAKWDAMSKEEKLATIEKRHAAKKAKMEEKWNSMSDDEKIAFVEKRMQKRAERPHGEAKPN